MKNHSGLDPMDTLSELLDAARLTANREVNDVRTLQYAAMLAADYINITKKKK